MSVDMTELKKKLPSSDIIDEYIQFLNAELRALKDVWEPYLGETAKKRTENPMILNHAYQITVQYENLHKIAAILKDPELAAKIIDAIPEDMYTPHHHHCDCGCVEKEKSES